MAKDNIKVLDNPIVLYKEKVIGTYSSVSALAKSLQKELGANYRGRLNLMLKQQWTPTNGKLMGYSVREVEKKEKYKDNGIPVTFVYTDVIGKYPTMAALIKDLENKTGLTLSSNIKKLLKNGWLPGEGQLEGYSIKIEAN